MRLSDYLSKHKLTHEQFAARIGATQASVSRYAAGKRIPRPQVLHKIKEATGGKVTANDFVARALEENDGGVAA